MRITKPNSAKPAVVGHATTPVPIVQAKSALAPNPVDEKTAAPGRGNVCIKNKTVSKGISYNHSVNKQQGGAPNNSDQENHRRVAVVFRQGNQKSFKTDSGTELLSLLPPPRSTQIFGAIAGLDPMRIYTRKRLVEMGAYR
jgi:hypothetical protein